MRLIATHIFSPVNFLCLLSLVSIFIIQLLIQFDNDFLIWWPMVVEGLGQGRVCSTSPSGAQGPRLLPSGRSATPQAAVLSLRPLLVCHQQVWILAYGKRGKWRMCSFLCTGSSGKLRISWPARGLGTRPALPSAPLSRGFSVQRKGAWIRRGRPRLCDNSLWVPQTCRTLIPAPFVKRGTTVPIA